MSAVPALKPATYDDLLALPPNRVGQIIDGVLYSHPRPAGKHITSGSSLGFHLGPPFHRGRGGPGGWRILVEPEIHLGNDVLVPDMAGWRRERMPDPPVAAWIDLAPDWVGEILSPGTARVDRIKKMPIYAANGVRHLWLIDPEPRTLEAYENQQDRWLLIASYADEDVARILPFDAVELELALLWD
jgi:Uma2 family endonuclease